MRKGERSQLADFADYAAEFGVFLRSGTAIAGCGLGGRLLSLDFSNFFIDGSVLGNAERGTFRWGQEMEGLGHRGHLTYDRTLPVSKLH